MKRILSLVITIAMMLSLAVPAAAAPKVPAAEPEAGARETVILNAGFHCNANGGNGRVWVDAYTEKYEADKALKKNGIGGVLEDLVYLEDNCWLLANTTDYVCPECGSSVWVSYSNKSGVPNGKNIQLTHGTLPEEDEKYDGTLSLTKTVDGIAIGEWEFDGITIFDVIGDISFKLFSAVLDGSGNPVSYDESNVIGTGELDIFGEITIDFTEELNGWYAVVEYFTPESIAEELFEDAGPVFVYFKSGNAIGAIGSDFDYDPLYEINYNTGEMRQLGMPGLNGGGEVFYIGVTNTETGVTYDSFCAHAGSFRFAGDNHLDCDGYLVAKSGREIEEVDYDQFLSAMNFINDTYGELNDNRIIAQTVVWALLGAIDIESEAFAGINLNDDEKAAVIATLGAANGNYAGEGKVIDVVYLLCDKGHDFSYCQPQLVPIFGEYVEVEFDNKVKEEAKFNGTMQAIFDITGTRNVIEYDYRLAEVIIQNTLVTFNGVMDGRGFTINEISVNGGGTFEISKSGHNGIQDEDDKIGLTYYVSVENGDIVVTFDENYINSSITVKAYKELPDGKFDNSKHFTDESGTIIIPLPDGAEDTFWLFIHIESLTYYDGSYERYIADEYTEEVDYGGAISLVVTDELGEAIFEVTGTLEELEEYIDLMGVFTIPGKFGTGKYMATLSGEGFESMTLEGEIVDRSDVITFEFGSVVVQYEDRIEDPGEPTN